MDHEDPQKKIIQIDEALVKRELSEVVRETVEETLNKLFDAEADELCKGGRYERSPARVDTRVGSYCGAPHFSSSHRRLFPSPIFPGTLVA